MTPPLWLCISFVLLALAQCWIDPAQTLWALAAVAVLLTWRWGAGGA